MFETLAERLQGIFKTLRGGTLSEAQVEAALREMRLALLEADVHFRVVKEFLSRVKEKATGQDVLASLSPSQAVLRVVRDEMVTLLGEAPRLETSSRPPTIVLMTGLQGSGKTTSTAKLAFWLKKGGHHPLVVSTDVHRPAAPEQLRLLSEPAGLKVSPSPRGEGPSAILRMALDEARAVGHDFLLVDTAGRLHIDVPLMEELKAQKELAAPKEVLYVADAMTGQDAVRSAEEFHRQIGLTGLVLAKLDGDARGGAALSAAAVTGCAVKFAGTGEKIGDFEPFQPERMVSRILGMGDVLTLIERAEEAFDQKTAESMARKLRHNDFTLEDFRDQMKQLHRMGPIQEVLSMIPGASSMKGLDAAQGERDMNRAVAIIDSMTPKERAEPSVLNGSRRKRIAKGSGTAVEDVNRLLKQFLQMKRMMKTLGGGKGSMRSWAARLPQFR